MFAKSLQQKSSEAYHKELIDREDARGIRREFGIKPIYHTSFSSYLFWMVTGQGKHPFSSTESARSFYGPRPATEEVIPWLQQILSEELSPLLFNPYRYLADLLRQEAAAIGYDSASLAEIHGWLDSRIAFADVQAHSRFPAIYNFPTLLVDKPQRQTPILDVSATTAPPSTEPLSTDATLSPWAPLLNDGLSEESFFVFLQACGLLTSDGSLTPLGKAEGPVKARRAPWVGTLQALINAKLLDSNAAAICRALADPAGKLQVTLTANSLLDPSRKSEGYQQTATALLRTQGLLRN